MSAISLSSCCFCCFNLSRSEPPPVSVNSVLLLLLSAVGGCNRVSLGAVDAVVDVTDAVAVLDVNLSLSSVANLEPFISAKVMLLGRQI